MSWILQVICIGCLFIGAALAYNGKHEQNEDIQKIGYFLLFIGGILFIMYIEGISE